MATASAAGRSAVPLPVTATAGGRLPGVEGLRAVAVIAVVLSHLWILDGGERVGTGTPVETLFLNLALGVTLFFSLSGFLLYRPFAAAIARGTRLPSVPGYFRNRALRILPAYWVILLVVAFVLQTATRRDPSGAMQFTSLDDPVDLLKAALLIQDYAPGSTLMGIGPAWSLAVEVVFYLLLPVLALAAARVARVHAGRGRRVLVLLGPPVALLALGLSGRYVAGVVVPGAPVAGYEADWHTVVERSFWCQADLFAFGMVAAVVHTEVVDGRLVLPRWWRAAALGVAALIVAAAAMALNSGQLSYRPENTAVGVAAALLLAVATFPSPAAGPTVLQRVLEHRLPVAIGLVSYSLFLWNEPAIRWLTRHDATRDGVAGLGWNVVLAAAVLGALSAASYRWVEKPALRRKRGGVPMPPEQREAAP